MTKKLVVIAAALVATGAIAAGARETKTSVPVPEQLYVSGGDFALGPRAGDALHSGAIVMLDGRTGAYKCRFRLVPDGWNDGDEPAEAALIQTRGVKALPSLAPRDGHLYGLDLATDTTLLRAPAARTEDVDEPVASGRPIHFCPGSVGVPELNGPADDPHANNYRSQNGGK
jgi:alcohol dehydrogenase (cytochrome c)